MHIPVTVPRASDKSTELQAIWLNLGLTKSEHESHKKPINPSVSALVIVPHKDLALQLARWIQVITESKIQVQCPKLSSVVQVLAKIPGEPLEDRLIQLERVTPHILIGTPQVLLSNYDRLKLHRLNTVMVDEVDYLIETIPNLPDKFKRKKMRKKIAKYPGPTRHLLNKVLETRMIKPGDTDSENSLTPTRTTSQSQISGTPGKAETSNGLPNATHSVLVVNEELEIRNIEGAIASPDPQPVSTEEGETASQPDEDEVTLHDVVTEGLSGVNLGGEDILAPEAPGLIKELKGYGVDTRPLDMLSSVAGRNHTSNGKDVKTTANDKGPILLVSIHGVSISPIFPTSLSWGYQRAGSTRTPTSLGRVDSYTHIAGRTGRFGKTGKTIAVVEKIEEGVDDGKGGKKKRVVKDEEKKIKGILREMKIVARKVEHFE
ncbi:hypothetical protein BDM02DRAFT_3262483 [Thelephora ganbajun]|uniref:Uncharacterized protein n=1 Tax=Thelephora ganbajun TaxID=370292 RepID=A0ACB6Z8R7_THEGA|nr:hypothetical protein BDM02DRAFT_3262483 [Thelephora ganbajun]